MGKKILITGGSGFIGSHLAERCIELGHKVKVIAPYNIENSYGWIDNFKDNYKKKTDVVLGDVNDYNFVKKETKNFDVIYHLAALISIPYSYKSPKSYLQTNINGTYNILEAAKENNIGLVVNTSTSEVYGSAQYTPIDEEHPLNAQSPYAATKIAADHLTLSYFRSFGVPVVVLRPFNTFGPRQSQRAAIPAIINQILDGNEKIKLGNIKTSRDFTFVSDTVEGYIKLINNKNCIGEVINLGNGISFTIKETVEEIAKLMNKDIKIILDKTRLRPKKSEVNLLLSNNKKAKKILKWRPKYNGKKGFIKGLRETIEWFRIPENLKHYKQKNYNI